MTALGGSESGEGAGGRTVTATALGLLALGACIEGPGNEQLVGDDRVCPLVLGAAGTASYAVDVVLPTGAVSFIRSRDQPVTTTLEVNLWSRPLHCGSDTAPETLRVRLDVTAAGETQSQVLDGSPELLARQIVVPLFAACSAAACTDVVDVQLTRLDDGAGDVSLELDVIGRTDALMEEGAWGAHELLVGLTPQ